jgi:hypothetical protein
VEKLRKDLMMKTAMESGSTLRARNAEKEASELKKQVANFNLE